MGVGLTISSNLAISKEEGETIYNNYMKAFPGIATYFKKMAQEALDKGYVEIDHITKRKSYVDFYPEYKRLKDIISKEGFWDTYRKEKELKSDKFINELKGIVRDYFKYQGMIQRKSFNYPVQGSGASITKLATCYLFEWILSNKKFNEIKIVNCVHDEILVECPHELDDEVARKLEECMVKAGSIFFTRVPLEAKAQIGDSWLH